MSWSDTPVNGQQSVAANKTPLNQAFTYIANSQKNDHYWDNANANFDGRHQFVQMPETTNTVGGIIRPNFGTDMDSIFYSREKTSTEAPDKQLIEGYYAQKDGAARHTLQLGIRAMVSFRISGSAIVQNGGNDWDYQHNVSTVVRTSEGRYTITFTTALPTDRYIVSGSLVLASIVTASRDSTIITRVKSVSSVQITASNSGGNFDPDAIDLIIFGG